MQPDDILEYRDKIIDAFKDGTFLSEYLKNPDGTGYEYVLKNVKKFTQEIESMSKKINLSLFEEFFESSSPANYAKMLINTNPDENKKIVEEIKDRISNLKDRIKEMTKKEEKIKILKRQQRLLKKLLIAIKMLQNIFSLHQNLINENQNQRLKKVLQME